MNIAEPPLQKAGAGAKVPTPLKLHPSFLGALRAAWLFAWKTEFTLRRVPVLLAGLLVLPVLVYITTPSPWAWRTRHLFLGFPQWQLERFYRQLDGEYLRIQPAQRSKLLGILKDEYARTEEELRQGESRQASKNQQNARIRACFERIRRRAQSVLNEAQFRQFSRFNARWLEEAQRRADTPRWRRSGPFYHWLIDFYFFVLLPLNCVRVSGAIIRDELQSDTLGFLITRPLSRAKLLIVKYVSQTGWLELLALAEALLLFASGALRQIPALWGLLPLFLGVQFLAVPAWSALGALLGLATQRYMAVAIVYGLIVEMGIGRIPTNINTLSLMRHLKTLLAHNAALQDIYAWPSVGAPAAVGALVFAALLFLFLAATLFTLREYHHTAEMQK